MKNLLITGGTGFVGKNLIERFAKENEFHLLCYTMENDKEGIQFLSKNKVSPLFEKELDQYEGDIDYCIHLASYGVAYGDRNVDQMVDVNIKLSERIMRFCSNHKCKLFINTGSCFEYGTSNNYSLIKENNSLFPEDIYAATKVACETILKVYSDLLQIKMITIRPFSIFGKYEGKKRLVPLVFNAGLNKQIIEMTGGQQIRDYMDVRDVADAIYLIIKNESKTINHEAINICSGNPVSVKYLIDQIIETCKFNKHLFEFGKKQYRKNESMFFAGDNSRLHEIIGDFDYSVTKDKIAYSFNVFKESQRDLEC